MYYLFIKLLLPWFLQSPYNEVMYSFPENTDGKILEYFGLDQDSGILYLKKSLLLDGQRTKTYGVGTVEGIEPLQYKLANQRELVMSLQCTLL